MFSKRLNPLAERKRLLTVEADLQRRAIELEFAVMRARLENVQGTVRAVRPWLLAGGTLVGLLLARSRKRRALWIPLVLAVLRWMRKGK